MEVYSLVSSAKRYSPDFTQITAWSGTCSFSKPSQFPRKIKHCCHFLAQKLFKTHKLFLSYQVSTYSWAERVHMWVKCLAQEHNATAQLTVKPSRRLKPAIFHLQVARVTTESRRPTHGLKYRGRRYSFKVSRSRKSVPGLGVN